MHSKGNKSKNILKRMSDNSKRYIIAIIGIFFAILLGIKTEQGRDGLQIPGKDTNTQMSSTEHQSDKGGLSICFLDVGQADAALVECEGHYMLIDGGNAADSSKIYTLLRDRGIQYIDVVVASHAHEDHVGGLAGALNYAAAGTIFCPTTEYETNEFQSFKKYADQKGGITVPSKGDSFSLGSAVVDILGVNAVEGDNDSSIILKISYGDTAFIFTGDAERAAEEAVLEAGEALEADVLKVSHHGSDTSTIYPFLREVMPEYAVISVGADNAYGHPTEVVLSRLEDAGATVYRTDEYGDIWCYSDGVNVTFDIAPSKSADNEPIKDEKEQENVMTTENQSGEIAFYILNVKSRKFHYPDCESVLKMSEKNKSEYAGNRGEIIEMGYAPCGNCKP